MVDRIPAKKSVERVLAQPRKPAPSANPVRQGDPNPGYGKAQDVIKVSDAARFHLYHRDKEISDCIIRRYFVGGFQIAYVREDRDGLTLWNVGPDPAKGQLFKDEDKLHDFLRRMLME